MTIDYYFNFFPAELTIDFENNQIFGMNVAPKN